MYVFVFYTINLVFTKTAVFFCTTVPYVVQEKEPVSQSGGQHKYRVLDKWLMKHLEELEVVFDVMDTILIYWLAQRQMHNQAKQSEHVLTTATTGLCFHRGEGIGVGKC